jgi:ABC-2 type transport system permease protein
MTIPDQRTGHTSQARPDRGVVRLVAYREIAARLASKAFRIMTLAMVVVIVAFILVLKFAGGDSGSTVGFTQPVAALRPSFVSVAAAVGETVTVSTVDQAAGEAQVRAGELDALVTGTPEALQVVVRQDLSPELRNALTVLVRQIVLNEQIARAGGDPAAVAAAVDAASFGLTTLEPPREFQLQRLVFGIIVGVVVYIALMVYGQLVAQGVVEEKSSRVVELLLTTIRPWQLMLGKVVGIGLVGLAQLLLVAVVGVGVGLATDTVTFPAGLVTGIAGWAIAWFLLGYLVYALMFASLAALVSRQEDVAGVTTPALMLIILPYVLGISILPADPDNGLLALLSLVPLFSPTIMPMRIAMGAAPAWQIALSTALTVGLAVVLVWLAGRIYGNAVMRMGSRIRLRDAFRSAA